jgi:membrane protease YdiL (CAAX protease family)
MSVSTPSGSDFATRGDTGPGALEALAWWTAWCVLPSLLARVTAPPLASLAAFAAVAAGLLATRPRPAGGSPARVALACGLALAAGALAQPAWLRLTAQIGLALGLPPAAPPPAGPLASAPIAWLAVGAVGPLAEELLYRERTLGALRAHGTLAAVAVSSALFALPHREPWSMLGAGLLGLWLGALALAQRGVALCVGYHAGVNLACLSGGMWLRPRATCAAAALAGAGPLCAALKLLRVRRAAPLAAGLAAGLVAGSAVALVVDFRGELAIDPIHPAFPPARIEGVGVATLNGTAGGAALETLSLAGGLSGTDIVPVTDPLVSNGGLVALRVSGRLGNGALRPFQPAVSLSTPQLSHGELPVRGSARLCMLVENCGMGLDLPFTWRTAQGTIGLGVGGAIAIAPLSTIRHTLLGAPWTPRTALLTVPTPSGGTVTAFASGFAHGPLSFTGSTARAGGGVQLVTPLAVHGSEGLAPPSGFARLTLHFVPEPRALFVLAPSIALLAAGARRRRRRGGSS